MKKRMPLAGHTSAFKTTFAYSLSALLAASPAFSQTVPSNTLPTGGSVSAGTAAISQSGAVMNVQQSTNRAAVNWNTFNVGQSATVNFQQPSASSVTLNRVLDTNPSQIFGQINANGQIYLVNPNGIYFGPTARVDVGGLVATTHSMSDADFMAGKTTFDRNGATGKVINDGTITSKLGGYIALLAPEVRNAGVIVAQSGTVALASGEAVTLNFDPANSLTNILVTPSKIDALVENRKIVKAPDGQVILSAQAFNELNAGVIKNSGNISAVGVSKSGGRVFLGASRSISQSGTISASSTAGKGGTVKLNAKTVSQSGSFDVSSSVDKGGRVEITGDTLTLAAGSSIDATGPLGGGTVLVGGDWQGSNGVEQATTVLMEQGATIDASATQNGDGGTVVLWSDIHNAASTTTALGSVLAMGGPNGGNGGKVETSGHRIAVDGFSVSTLAPNGEAGLWLLDPYNVTIQSAGNSGTYGVSSGTYTPNQDSSTIAASTISSALNSGNVTIVTGSSGSQTGTISVDADITKTSGGNNTLTLQAADTITIDAAISSTAGKLNVNLYADNDMGVHDGLGIVLLNKSITTNGGNIAFGDGATLSINGVTTKVGGDVYVGGSSEVVLDTRVGTTTTGGGSITVNGETMIGNTNGFRLTTGGGNVSFTGLLNSANSYTYVGLTSGSNGNYTWNQARLNAKSGTGDGVGDAYLATITSRLENSIAIGVADYKSAWLGGLRGGLGFEGQSTDWYWVTGPEGLQNNGRGQAFYNQATNTAINGAYINWTNGEPNGTGTDPVTSEMAMQFWYAQGQWNDLNMSTNYPLGYVKETNLAASRLTVDAAAGNVSFGGAVGGNKAIGNLNVTANNIAVAASVTTEGSQTYNGNVSVSGANIALTTKGPAASAFDILFNNGVTKTGGSDTNLTVKSHRDIYLNSNVSASGAKLNLLLESDYEDNWGSVTHDGAGFIQVNNNITTNGGSLQLGNNATATIGGATVVVGGDLYVAGTSAQTFSTGGGAITVNGETLIANPAGLNVNSSGGNVLFGDEINSANSYAYTYVAGGLTWDSARIAAKGNTGGAGALGDTYLATITSRLENSIGIRSADYASAWLGALRGGTGFEGSSADWYWVTGPEGYANAGRGQKFFTQTGAGTGTAVNNSYINWNTGEPNGGSPNATTFTSGINSGELALQFIGTQGKWNDLSWAANWSSGYVKETNLASSALAINAGTGTLTVNGGIGGSKALASLNVTAASTAINGDSVITTGAQTFNNTATVTNSGGITLGGSSLAVTNSGQSLVVNASTGAVTQQAGLDITSAGGVQITGGAITLNDTITASGNILVNGSGTVTIGSGAFLASTGGDVGVKTSRFVNNSGSTAISASAGKWQVWSTNASPFSGGTADVRNGLTADYKQYNATYGVTTVLGTGNGYLYSYAPTLSVSLTGSTTKVYDAGNTATLAASNYTFTGTVDGDTAVLNNPTGGTYTSAGTGTGITDVGTGKAVTASGLTVLSASKGSIAVYGYGLNSSATASIGAITKAPLTVSANSDAKFVTQSDAALYNSVSYTGFVGGQTSGTAGLTGTLAINRTNSAVNGAGNYTGVLVPSGLSASNYAITYTNGDYQIIPADKLLVRVTNLTTTYGSAATYAVTSAQYLDGSNIVQTLGAPTRSGNTLTYSDGSGGTTTFTLGVASAQNSTGGYLQVGAYDVVATSITGTSANFSNNLAVVGNQTVTAKSVTASATSGLTKVYDGTTNMYGLSLAFTGIMTNDVVTGSGAGAFNSKNAGSSVTYTISNLDLSGADAQNYYLSGGRTFTGSNGTITQRVLTTTFAGIDKVYDGNTTATVTETDNRISGDSLTVARTATFADKNVATGKAVSITGVSISGTSASNYSLASTTGSTTATITRLDSVTWTGPASGGNWFDPANWAGGAVPDLSNVANVVIPQGAVVEFGSTVVAPAQAGPVNVNGIGTAGGLNVTGGNLNVGGGGMQLAGLTQSGGAISNTGTTTVTTLAQSGGSFSGTGAVNAGSFSQTGGNFTTAGSFTSTQGFSQGSSGSMVVGGDTNITDPSGGVVLGNLTTAGALNVNSTGGAITQAAGTALAVTGASNLVATNGGAPAEITLANSANSFGGVVSGRGSNIALFGANGLTLGNVVASGTLTASAGTGKLVLVPGSTQTASGGFKLSPDPRPVLIVYPQVATTSASVSGLTASTPAPGNAQTATRYAVSEGTSVGNARGNAIAVSGDGLVVTSQNVIPLGKAVSLRAPDAQGKQIQTASIDVEGCSSCSFQFDRTTSVSAVDNGQGKITLSGTAPIEDYEKLLQSVQLNLAPGGATGPIKMRVSITDAAGRKTTKILTIQRPATPAAKVADAAPRSETKDAPQATQPTVSIKGGRLVTSNATGLARDVAALIAVR